MPSPMRHFTVTADEKRRCLTRDGWKRTSDTPERWSDSLDPGRPQMTLNGAWAIYQSPAHVIGRRMIERRSGPDRPGEPVQ